MHESSLARDLLRAVLDKTPPGATVRRVRGRIAETEALSPDSLSFHFGVLAWGTPAEGAALELATEHVGARCDDCGATYLPEHHLTLCPACGSSRGQILGTTGVFIASIDVT